MSKDFTLYPEALELEQLVFDEPCFGEWQNLKTGKNIVVDEEDRIYDVPVLGADIKAPTYSQAFRFFREKHLLEGLVLPQDRSVPDPLPIYFIAVISYEDGGMNELFNSTAPFNMLHYSEYEEAQLGCLRHLIKIVKENEKQI